ncbi:hypothetical protein JXQ70_05760 [bacterium]|nr:hypothetical protein [bacterium]
MSNTDDKQMDDRFHPRPTRFSLIIAVTFITIVLTLITLVLLEVTLKFSGLNDELRRQDQATTFDDSSEPDKTRFFKMRKNLDIQSKYGYRLKTNSMGMRSPEVLIEPAAGIFRIICVGDSVTFGWGVEADQAFPQLTECKLAELLPDRHIQVLNAGMPAYSSYQGLVYLQNELIAYKPDLVVFCFGHNDTFIAPLNDQEQVAFNRKVTTRLIKALSNLEIVLLFRHLLRDQVKTTQELPCLIGWKPRNDVEHFRQNLEATAETCSQHGIRLVLMTQATRDHQKPERAAYNQAVRAVAERYHSLLVDPDPILTGSPHFIDPGHPNATGHQIIADLLSRTLVEADLTASEF